MEPLSELDRVAVRLNRLALQRAGYRTFGLALLCTALLAPAALWLPSRMFAPILVALAGLCGLVGIASFWSLRRRWSRRLQAALWVEREVALDERLLTLVTAPEAARQSPLWSELERDNLGQLDRWKGSRLGIPRVPADAALLLVGAIAALLALAPGGGDAERPPPPPEFLRPPEEEAPQRTGAAANPGTAEAEGALSGPGAGDGASAPGTSSNLSQIQARLGERFARSFAASQLGGGSPQEESDGDAATDMRGDLPESDLGESLNQEGGMTPPEGMGHLVQDDADDGGETVRRFEAEGGEGTTGASTGGVRQGEAPDAGTAEGAPSSGDGGDEPRNPDDPILVSEDATQTVSGSGGSGPGDQPGTGPLLAGQPLDLARGRGVARFSLTLGALSDADGTEGGTLEGDIRSFIAEGERGDQSADAGVRRESVPPEYETVIKRVFERNS